MGVSKEFLLIGDLGYANEHLWGTSQLLYRVLRTSFNGSLQGLGIEPSKSHQNGKIDDPSLCFGCVCSWIVSPKMLIHGPCNLPHPECLQRPFLGDTLRLSKSASLIDFYMSEPSFGEVSFTLKHGRRLWLSPMAGMAEPYGWRLWLSPMAGDYG